MYPSVAARLYAGATDATAITMFETNEIAFDFSLGFSTVISVDSVSDALSTWHPLLSFRIILARSARGRGFNRDQAASPNRNRARATASTRRSDEYRRAGRFSPPSRAAVSPC